ncbi:Lipoprotein-releasing system transmembrane protein LolE [Candidatus Gullanella endobia]|uniref:Lipoprotein-releasing system transmembrane protein LolE n=1 Tax=Candidatus Gullanella endobia TaxID=1070130 RepID=A0A143WRF2_9ENTR|nr:lipoprotein-releasing ABC transporter permease subunit LolE [Candidatus Gullanella endobia]CUX96312.1 Lipoprotein-releasing system transmembrane protein LolE [Candidatus Gullanella endobia]
MKIPLSLQIALRFSYGQRRNGMLSLVSVISIIGIALGVVVLIIGLSAMNGFERELNNRILSVLPHGEIEPVYPPFVNWKKILKYIEKVPGILSATPYVNFTSLVEYNNKFKIIQIKGIDPDIEMRLSTLSQYIQDNSLKYFHTGQQKIIVGKGLADFLKINSGDWLTVMIPERNQQMKLKHISLQVSGILTLNCKLDHSFAIVPLLDAQCYLQLGEDISGISIKVNNIFKANKIVRDAGRITNTYVKTSSWISTYGYIYHDIQMIRTIMYLAMILVIGIACFNIISTLVIAVKDKNTDIAILRTFGARDELIYTIFIWYGTLIGITGIIFGAVLGVLIAVNLTTLVNRLERILGYHFLSDDIYFIDFLPTELNWMDVTYVLTTAILLTILISFYTAKHITYIYPTKVLSGR